jgi:hypothetical protein
MKAGVGRSRGKFPVVAIERAWHPPCSPAARSLLNRRAWDVYLIARAVSFKDKQWRREPPASCHQLTCGSIFNRRVGSFRLPELDGRFVADGVEKLSECL